MSDSEIDRLKREIAERQQRLAEIDKPVTFEQLRAMSAREIASLDPHVINRALREGATA